MPRHHTVWDAELEKQVDIPFTRREETARDAEEAAWLIEQAARDVITARKDELVAKLVDDELTLPEMRELMRLERGLP